MKHTFSATIGAAIVALSLTAATANATIFIGLQQDAGPIVTVATSPGFAVFTGAFGQFENVVVSGFGQPSTVLPTLLQTGSVQVNNSGTPDAGVLRIYVTSTGNTAPTGLVDF